VANFRVSEKFRTVSFVKEGTTLDTGRAKLSEKDYRVRGTKFETRPFHCSITSGKEDHKKDILTDGLKTTLPTSLRFASHQLQVSELSA